MLNQGKVKMKLQNGSQLTVKSQAGVVVIACVDEYGPSTFGAGADSIHIPVYDLYAVIRMLQDEVDILEQRGYSV